MSLEILVDCGLSRPSRQRTGVGVAAWQFDQFSNTWLDPVTTSLWLRPPQLDAAWWTTNTGRYLKPVKADYSFTVSGNWQETEMFPGAGKFVHTNTVGEIAYRTVSDNACVYLSWFAPTGGDSVVEIEFGYSASFDYTDDVGFRVWSDGRTEVWRDGVLEATYSLNAEGKDRGNIVNTILILPHRGRDILVAGVYGGGFLHTFAEGYDEIAPGGSFWVKTPITTHFSCQFGAIEFPSSGTATSVPIAAALDTDAVPRWFGYAPDAASDLSASLALTGSGSAWTAEVSLSGGGTGVTPCMAGVHIERPAEFADTDSSQEFDLAPYCLSARLSVPDDPGGVEMSFELAYPDEIDAQVPLFLTLDHRPVRVLQDGVPILEGVTLPVRFEDGVEDGARTAKLTVRDRTEEMRSLVFREMYPFDGLSLADAASWLFAQAGIDDVSVDGADFEIPWKPPSEPKANVWQVEAAIGSSLYDEMARLVSEYASNWIWGVRPKADGTGIEGYLLDPALLSEEPLLTLYRTNEDARTIAGDPDQVYTAYRCEPMPIEANEVVATGRDPRTGRAFQAVRKDEASQDPTIAPIARPDNWLGAPRYFGLVSPRLTTMDAATRAVEYLFPQLSTRWWIDEWETVGPIRHASGAIAWRGEMVDLEARRETRITSFQVDFLKVETGWEAAPTAYTGGTAMNAGGLGLGAIRGLAQMRASRRAAYAERPYTLELSLSTEQTDSS